MFNTKMVEQATFKNEDPNIAQRESVAKRPQQLTWPLERSALKLTIWSKEMKVYLNCLGEWVSVSRDGTDLYLKAIKRMDLYICTTYENRSIIQICLDAAVVVLPEESLLPVNPTLHQQRS